MPFVRIQLKEGRSAEQKEALAKEIINTMYNTDFASKDTVRVIFEEMKGEDFYSGKDMKWIYYFKPAMTVRYCGFCRLKNYM